MNLKEAMDGMILSASGWRGVFAIDGNEQSRTPDIDDAHRFIAAAAADVFAAYLAGAKPLVLVGTDTRPTGKAIARAAIRALTLCGCEVRWSGYTAAPEIMAAARRLGTETNAPAGFMYISASHNPVGHNGIKFGLTDGGVLNRDENAALTTALRGLCADMKAVETLKNALATVDDAAVDRVFAREAENKKRTLDAYLDFAKECAGGEKVLATIRGSLKDMPLGAAVDFNGSARAASIDREFFAELGIKFVCVNDTPGGIAHTIIPEGESLDPCRRLLEDMHAKDPAFALGYVPDCDGDRGNLVVWDGKAARALEAQEVFALCCAAELAHLKWTGELTGKTAVAVNDPTSLRVDRIVEAFGAKVFRAEVGEANVVGLARKLRAEGWTVRILGEGSNGGNIVHPSAVRDPLSTVLSVVKLLRIPAISGGRDLGGIIAALPRFYSTPTSVSEAQLRVTTADHAALKTRYQHVFLREWAARKDEMKQKWGLAGWEAAAYIGIEEKRGIEDFGAAGRGGLRIVFQDACGKDAAAIWMRGSATEPVFRIMADAQTPELERELIQRQREMVAEADK